MARLRLFGPAREAAGTSSVTVPGRSVRLVMEAAEQQYGDTFALIVARSKIWVNGEPVGPDTPVSDDDEVAVIPPVSGG